MSTASVLEKFRFFQHDALDSTNLEARRLLKDSDVGDSPIVVVASTQTSGSGRMDRQWVSPVGNLYFSFTLSAAELNGSESQLPFLLSVALRDALFSFMQTGVSIGLKWPNDVLVDGKKISGMLIESVLDKEKVRHYIVGIGVNVASHPGEVIAQPATSLEHWCESPVDLEVLLSTILCHIEQVKSSWQRDGFEPIRLKWCDYALGMGQKVTVNLSRGTSEGVFDGINDDGSMRLLVGEEVQHITAGDVYLLSEGKEA
jgi:BirA family biotin operon repressor/biotin-[acetyl-CoA-carboxylase] ligase